jgi:hypothetical protein
MKQILFLIFLTNFLSLSAQIKIISNFQNANVEIIKIDNSDNKIIFKPSLKTKLNTTRCWFYFGITNYDTTKELILEDIYQIVYAAPTKLVYSYNKKDWHRLRQKKITDSSKIYSAHFKKDTLWVATGYPYTYSDIIHLSDSLANNKNIDTSTLTYSEAGRRIPLLTIGNKNNKQIIWIIGRQHAFEASLNFFIEGMIKFFSSNDLIAQKYRKKITTYIVPMMDVDNVFIGASGRMQLPVDFNRDWISKPHWKAIEAVEKNIAKTSRHKKFCIFLDIHSTYPGTTQSMFGIFNEYRPTERKFYKLKNFLKIFKNTSGYKINEIYGSTNEHFADEYFIKKNKYKNIAKEFSSTVECDWNLNNNGKELTENELKKSGYLFAKSIALYCLKINLSKIVK